MLFKACEILKLEKVTFVDSGLALGLQYGQFTIMNEDGYKNMCTTLFVDFGASHTVFSVVQFYEKSMRLVMNLSTDMISSDKIDGAIVEKIIRKYVEEDEEGLEEADEEFEDVMSQMNIYNNRKKLEDFKILCSAGTTKQVTASWNGKEDYEGYCRHV